MTFLRVFLVLIIFFIGTIFFVHAQKKPKLKWDGPYYAACVAEQVGNTLTGWAKARGTGAVRNGSYMCSMGQDVTPVSDSNIRGIFSDDVSHSKSIEGGTLYADSTSWGSDKHSNTWCASVSDSAP